MKPSTLWLVPFLALFAAQCAHSPKDPKAKTSKSPSAGISDKGNNLYYFLVSQLESLEGKEESSLFYLNKSIKKDSDSSYLLLQKAYRLARDSKFGEAQKLASETLKKDPNNASLLLLLGKLATNGSKSDEAIGYYTRAIAADPENEEAHVLLAREYVTAEAPKKAIAVLKKLIQINPESVEANFYLGSVYATHEKNYGEALKVYDNILEMYPDDPRILQVVAELHLAQKNFSKALAVLLQLRDLVPSDLNLNVRIGLLYYELKDVANAIKAFERIHALHPKSDRINYYLGLLHHENKDEAEALKFFAHVAPSSEFYGDTVARQVLLLRNSKRDSEAVTLARQAIDKNPKIPELYDLASSLYAIQRDFNRALEILNRGISQFPDNERLLFSKGVVYEKMGQTAKSVEAMKKVLEVNGQNVLALNFIGYTYAEQGKNLDEAQTLIEKAIQLKPTDGYILDSLGWVHFQKGAIDQAEAIIEKANRMSPNEPTIIEHLGDIQLKKKNNAKAKAYFETALEIINKKNDPESQDQDQIKRLQTKIGGL